MRMYFRFIGFLYLLLFLSSCAQVGTISGGEEDSNPPRVKTMNPPNKSIQFSDKQIIIEFDEFIKLNSPAQTISVIPPDFKVNAIVKGKTVTLTWTEDLQSKTTYSIFLNKTIQDITETNDSIMQLVFSTGDFLDSLNYSVSVVDSKSAQVVNNAIVGLFSSKDTLKPSYFAESNSSGKAQFSFVKQGTYFLRAFVDDNKDLQISKSEKIGFKSLPISLDSSYTDSIPILLFAPIVQQKITSLTFVAPGLFMLGANLPISTAKVMVNDIDVTENVRIIAKDSIHFTLPQSILKEASTFNVYLVKDDFKDSSKVRITAAGKTKELNLSLLNNGEAVMGERFEFTVADKIEFIDTSKFLLRNAIDSSQIVDYKIEFQGNKLFLELPASASNELLVDFMAGAISGEQKTTIKKSSFRLKRLLDKELGIINLDAHLFAGAIIVEVYFGGKKINEIELDFTKTTQLSGLKPGEYTFKVIEDSNKNGYWETGSFENDRQAEKIYPFSEPTKVRANWEINVELIPKDI